MGPAADVGREGRARRGPAAASLVRAATGADYLARKRDLLASDRSQWTTALEAAERLYRTAEGEAAASRRHGDTEQAIPQSRLLLDAAFLVPRARAGRSARCCSARTRMLGELGIAVSLTGPGRLQLRVMARARSPGRVAVFDTRGGSLLDLVDNLLNQGVVLTGELTLSLAGVDLVYARLSLLLCAADFLLALHGRRSGPARRLAGAAPAYSAPLG
jgi:hypothetical protein